MTTTTREKFSMREFLYQLARIENKDAPFKPEYLPMKSDEDEAETVCLGCDREYGCPSPYDYCDVVINHIDDKQAILSAANRVIHALMKCGSFIFPGYYSQKPERIYPTDGDVAFDWCSEYGEQFCKSCRFHGKTSCPEDVYDESCVRNNTVRAVEDVVSAVNEMI